MLHLTSGISVIGSRAFVYMMIPVLLYACGFQLRGAIDISEEIAPVYVQQGSLFELGREIRSLLATNKIKVVEKESQSRSTLVLVNESRGRRLLSVDGSGRAKEYQLTYTVNFVIKISQSGETSDSLSISRSLLFDPDAVLAVSNESEILYRDMQRDIARLILLRMQAQSRNSATQKADQVQAEPNITE